MNTTRPRASWLLTGFLFLFLACGGGSCSSCSACEGCGITPIPGGFPISDRIPNSAQVRLTESGISFIEDNISSILETFIEGGLAFDIPRTDTSFDVAVVGSIDVGLCPGSDCQARAEIRGFELDPESPNRLRAHIQVTVDTRDTSGGRRAIPVRLRGGCTFLGCLVNTTCQVDLDSRRGSRDYVGLVATIDFEEESRAARAGYTRIVVSSVDLADGEGIEDDDVTLGGCTGLSGAIINLVSGLIKGTIIDQLTDQISTLLQDTVDEQLCTTRGVYGCPTGTFAVPDETPDSVCRYENDPDADCVPTLLGMDGQGDVGANAFGNISPGTRAPIQLLLASGGPGEAINGGMSLFMYGGMRSTDRTFTESPAHNPCVPVVEPPPIPTIPRIDTFRGNTLPFSDVETHVGIGLSEQYLNYASYGMFDSGMLCIGTGTRLSQQLSSGLFSLLVISLNNLVFPEQSSPIAISVRPQRPPVMDIGAGTADNPLLTITMPELEIDFYIWSTERYIRFMTYKTDLTIPINLTVEGGQIVPLLGDLAPTNSSILNSELLTEDPASLAALLEDLISSFAGMLTSGIGPIDLPAIMGFELEVPEGGVIGFDQGGDSFLGIFANLSLAGPAPYTAMVDTELELTDLELDPRALTLEHWGEGQIPSVHLWMNATGGPAGAEYEYSWRLDEMQWSDWTTDRHLRVEHRTLLFQAEHEFEVRARVIGGPETTDLTPASATLIVDTIAPTATLNTQEDGRVTLDAFDIITEEGDLEYRWRVDGGAWVSWRALQGAETLPLLLDASLVEVEVRDETGNVGSATQAIVRGLPRPDAAGCDCRVATAPNPGDLAGVLLVVLGALFMRRRRLHPRPAKKTASKAKTPWYLWWVCALPLFLLTGCSCAGGGSPPDAQPPGPCGNMCTPSSPAGSLCCEMTQMCVGYDLGDFCEPGFRCANIEALSLDENCEPQCGDCQPRPPLSSGLLATHLDAIRTSDGTVLLSGYSPGSPPRTPYGDLVFGPWIPDVGSVGWEIVDGAPAMPVTAGIDGWRGGVSEPGDDVGRWTSMVESGDAILISYYDRTNTALKLATVRGGMWQTETVDNLGDAGRYSSMAVNRSGEPVIAYQVIEAPATAPGRPISRTRVATRSGGIWEQADIHVVEIACRPDYCPEGSTCLTTGECIIPSSDCEECLDDTICSNGSCVEALPDNYVEDITPATGTYNALQQSPDGFALVWYDRSAGNIMGARYTDTWSDAFLIEGYGRELPDVGDCGMGASLTVDSAGVWHVSYIDGTDETLRYAVVNGDRIDSEVVADGSTDGTTRYMDGRHLIGDDSSIGVTGSGEVRIVYQDATSQTAMLARRSTADGSWTVSVLDNMDHTGFWLEQIITGERSEVITWWRNQADRTNANGVRILIVE